jgi:hypothetical protein
MSSTTNIYDHTSTTTHVPQRFGIYLALERRKAFPSAIASLNTLDSK